MPEQDRQNLRLQTGLEVAERQEYQEKSENRMIFFQKTIDKIDANIYNGFENQMKDCG